MASLNTQEISSMVHSISLTNPSWDLFVLAFWAIGSIIYAFTAGRGRVINILMSIYIAKLLVHEAPFLNHIITKNLPTSLFAVQQLITFLIIFLILFMLLGRYAFRTSADGRQAGALLFGLVFAVLQIGLLINVILTFIPLAVQYKFGGLIHLIFIKEPASFVWLVIPLVFLILLGKHVADPNEI